MDGRQTVLCHAQEAAEFMVTVLRSKTAPLDLRFKAAIAIQDRGIGKPAQMIRLQQAGGAGSYDWSKLNDEQLRQADEILRIASSGVGDTD